MLKTLAISILIFVFAAFNSALAQDFARLQSDAIALGLENRLQVRTSVSLVADQVETQGQREFHYMKFSHPTNGSFQMIVSGPLGFAQSSRAYPVLFIVSGFQTGAQSVALVGDVGDRILVGYQYPFNADEILAEPNRLLEFFPRSIGQMVGIWSWLKVQKWAEAYKIDTLGVSLGSLLLPVSLRVAERVGFQARKTIFAFGGADFGSIVEYQVAQILARESANSAITASAEALKKVHLLVEGLTYPIKPRLHLAYLRGSFLVVRGLQDEVFPASSSEALVNLLPQPKTAVVLDSRHINVDTEDIIKATVQAIQEFINKP